ncbi:hypothetical protein VJI72_07995, partial [Parvimonas micra]|uniref:hypothetical protein n=1 Tax=Parvimonas micra TaxID=33033 RepID=UPI002B465CF0
RRTELANVNDTIFGQDWQSENPTIAQAMISCNAYFKGIAGYSITVKETGTSTAMANEAATLISGKSYQIANAAKRIIDYNVAVVVMDGGTNVTAQLQSSDYLFGTVVF